MTGYFLYGLLWAIVVLMAVLPYLVAPMMFGFVKAIQPKLEPLWPTFRLISVFLGLAVFGALGSALLSNEVTSRGMNFVGNVSFAACITTSIYLLYLSYQIGRGE